MAQGLAPRGHVSDETAPTSHLNVGCNARRRSGAGTASTLAVLIRIPMGIYSQRPPPGPHPPPIAGLLGQHLEDTTFSCAVLACVSPAPRPHLAQTAPALGTSPAPAQSLRRREWVLLC